MGLPATKKWNKNQQDKDLTAKIRDKLKFDPDGRCINAFQVITEVITLTDAYETIKNKPGNMVAGTDKVTLDGISED
jgi:hypothetical protein